MEQLSRTWLGQRQLKTGHRHSPVQSESTVTNNVKGYPKKSNITLLRVIPTLTLYSGFWHTIWKYLWHIYTLTSHLAFFVAFCLPSILTFFLASILTFFLASILAFYLASIQAFIPAFILAFYLAFCLASYLAFILTFSLTWALPDLNRERQISVLEVRRCPLRSGARRTRRRGGEGGGGSNSVKI